MSRYRRDLALLLLAFCLSSGVSGAEEQVFSVAGAQGTGVGFYIGAGDVVVTSAWLGSPISADDNAFVAIMERANRGLSLWRGAKALSSLTVASLESMPACDAVQFLTPAPVRISGLARGQVPGLSGDIWIAAGASPVPPGSPLVCLQSGEVVGVAVRGEERGTVVAGLANLRLLCFDAGIKLARQDKAAEVPRLVGNWPYGGSTAFEFRLSDLRRLEEWREVAGLLPTSQTSIVATDGLLFFGDNSQRIYCVDSERRNLVWSQQLAAPVIFPPTLDEARVYAVVVSISLEVEQQGFLWSERHWYAEGASILYAFDRSTGEVNWSHRTGFRTSPVVQEGCVYFGGMTGYGVLNAATGRSVWIQDRPLSRQELPFWYLLGTPTADTLPVLALRLRQREDPKRILRVEGDMKVLLVDKDTGKTRQEIKLPRIPKSDHPFAAACSFSPSLDRVTVAVGNAVRSYQLPEGKLLWETMLDGSVVPGALLEGTHWFLPLDAPGVVCVDLGTGKKVWEFRQLSGVPGALTFQDGTLFFGALDSNLYALSSKDGTLTWKLECPGGRVSGAPAIVGDLLYAAASDGRLYAVVWRE